MSPPVLLRLLRDPGCAGQLSPQEWDLVIRQARAARLLARIEPLCRVADNWEDLPLRVRDNVRGERVWADYYQVRVRWELHAVRRALRDLEIPLMLLKGAAYLVAELPPSEGRTLSDLDLLVRREDLERVEVRLQEQGWESRLEDDYDQRYYREWMHEIPPLVHPRRGVEVDLHHNLLALTGRYRVPAASLWREARPLEPGLLLPAPTDLILHSAVHLVVSDELRGGLRDLFDIHQLYLHYRDREADFDQRLAERARELGVARPFWYVVQAAHRLLGTPFPPSLLEPPPGEAPGALTARLMNHLVAKVLTPRLPTEPRPALAQWLLYVRSHWVRMPPGLLASHLMRKGWRRLHGEAGKG